MKLRSIQHNMTEVEAGRATILFSYSTPVAAHIGGHFFRTNKHYSTTTSRHINKWLAGAKAEECDPDYFETLLEV